MERLVRALPNDVRKIISSFYNWNEVLQYDLERAMEATHLMTHGDDEQQATRKILRRLEWWYHLFRREGRDNWRLPNAAERLLADMTDLKLTGLVSTFIPLIRYNADKFKPIPRSISWETDIPSDGYVSVI